ncbi:phospho-N-acetylmuramoyl-pentapeptide-transferase [Anaerocolumna xylanovorans]|uniref:Phospho-N-acetylmuramoyl-pentapeptide-transferase n=1 Tax=Anaerocolumna xylanovorans DSM 12503 TaxID=1121345 RepID=A0A1M7YBE5_9FIRM|nr:phospho-N-acetylmuramoyl-pentapeptide-transferase [Anaerocolumna xylanovorans]SHO49955.1 Phospho-N-acetylmuramoyl-pentapeptide-transferase [Anaerocolumna xylanovorans DSM 12503]
MNSRILMPVVIAFVISLTLCPILIPFLKKLKWGQYVRNNGPKSHIKKSGTPTMGGIVILLSVTFTSVMYIKNNRDMIPVLFATVGFGLIGFLDDYLKIIMKRSMGLKVWQKLLGQILVSAVLINYFICYTEVGTSMLIPFTGGFREGRFLDLGIWFIPFMFIVLLGTVNGANFTDGLDGLAASVTLLITTFFSVAAIVQNSSIFPITNAAAGSLLGFLVFNIYPARVFMGDTGSLALGGFVAASAFMLKMPLFLIIVGLVYLIEVMSVILQVVYFRLTKGKRIFRMAPIHHHFELCGWSEMKVVSVFSIATAICCIIALLGI